MHIGILQCDNVDIKLQSLHGDYSDMFALLLGQTNAALTFTVYNVHKSQLPLEVGACDAYLISGSRYGVNDNLVWISMLEDFVRQLHKKNKKTIGICFGHQLIAKALGGTVIKSPKQWGVGISANKIIQRKPWMSPVRDVANLIVSHQDQVIELPAGAEVLASSDFCPFYMLQVDNHFLTLQGHPEYSKAYSQVIMETRKTILGELCYEQGLKSLELKEDSALMAQWMLNFINS